MKETKELRIRLTDEQYNLIRTKAQLHGFRTISAYVRDKLLRVPYRMEQTILDIYQKLIQIKP